jgi:hypothetical protein
MGNLFNFFVKQKKLALIFTVSVIAVGLLAFNNIQRDQFPAVNFEEMFTLKVFLCVSMIYLHRHGNSLGYHFPVFS